MIHSQQNCYVRINDVVLSRHKIKKREQIAEINNKIMEDITMNNSKKEVVITGKMVVKAAMVVALIAIVGMMIYGVVTRDSRTIGEASLLACVQTGYWSYLALEKQKKDKKNEVIA